jgi:membrane protein YqaA with SNARE-associated domain
MDDITIYLSLFANAFIAATLLPAASELAFAGLIASNIGQPLILLTAVSLGNILGSIVNWGLGKLVANHDTFQQKYGTKKSYIKAKALFERFGIYSLLFAWLPIIGDPLTFIAGVFRIRFPYFIMLVSIGKTLRYTAILWAVQAAQ